MNRRASDAIPALPQRRSPGKGPAGAGARARLTTSLLLVLLCAAAVQTARADGEVGLVIEENGQVRTYCVAYSGESLSGDDLLSVAGITYEDLGTGSGSVLCAIEEVGCFDASSYNTCWCECQGGGDCVYWAFFTRDYGSGWVYSARAFDRTNSNDGDLHAWKWGEGGPASAPAPSSSLTFESVCGHPPQGGPAPATATAPLPTPPPGGGTVPPGLTPTGTSEAGSATPFSSVSPSAPNTPGVTVTFSPQPTMATPLPPATARDEGDDGGSPAALLAFGAVAVGLVVAIGAAAYWRGSHGR